MHARGNIFLHRKTANTVVAEDLLRLLADHEVHGGEEVLLSTFDQTVTSQGQAVGGLLGTLREETDGFAGTDKAVGKATAPPGHASNGKKVPGGTHVLEGARQRVVPGDRVGASSEILVVLEVKSSVLYGFETLGDTDHVGDTVTLLDTETNTTVLSIIVVVLVSHKPLVYSEGTTGL